MCLALAVFRIALPAHAEDAVPFDSGFVPKWIESGIREKGLGYRPMSVRFDPELASDIKSVPADFMSPVYGVFETGPNEDQVRHLLVIDFSDNIPKRLIVDANGNSDLKDDVISKFSPKEYERPDGSTAATDYAKATVVVSGDGRIRGSLVFYYNRSNVANPSPEPKMINYYTDFGVGGDMRVEGTVVPLVLCDDAGSSRFSIEGGSRSAPLMWVDLDGNGKSDRGEVTVAGNAIEIEGKWWKVASMTEEGRFKLVKSEKPKAADPVSTKLDTGKVAPPFVGSRIGGGEVRFPGDFKGKILLIDFWATWCGPCIAEVPNVIAAYGKYHDRGLEVLGISLDREKMEDKIADFTKRKKMPWAQVYDGKGWKSDIAQLYEIRGIPHMLLVDGDTGEILANKSIRGDDLAPAIERALAGKKR
jgi:thiol-disulfide isomerase/thioredoxin